MAALAEPEVLVVGESLIDIVEADGSRTEHVGGSPANVALGLGRRGVRTALLTQIADDPRGAAIVEHLRASGVDVLSESYVLDRTSTALARVAADGQAEYAFDLSWEELRPHVSRPRVLHTGSIAAFLEPGAASVRDLLSKSDAEQITFDPNIRPALAGRRDDAVAAFEETATLTSLVKMSDQDAEWLYPGAAPDAVIDTVLGLGSRIVAITLGGDGAIVASADHRVRVDAVRVDAVDTIGAGDTFMCSLIHSLLRTSSGGHGHEALQRMGTEAARAAAITVSRSGADLPWAAEL